MPRIHAKCTGSPSDGAEAEGADIVSSSFQISGGCVCVALGQVQA